MPNLFPAHRALLTQNLQILQVVAPHTCEGMHAGGPGKLRSLTLLRQSARSVKAHEELGATTEEGMHRSTRKMAQEHNKQVERMEHNEKGKGNVRGHPCSMRGCRKTESGFVHEVGCVGCNARLRIVF